MNYLKPVMRRLITDPAVKNKLEAYDTDHDLLTVLTTYVPFATIASQFEDYYGVVLVDVLAETIAPSLFSFFEPDVLKKVGVLPYQYDARTKTYFFAVADFLNEDLRQSITASCRAQKSKARFAFSPPERIIETYHLLENQTKAASLDEKGTPEADAPPVVAPDAAGAFSAQEWLQTIIDTGIATGASDIHIERLEHLLQVRYRIDGKMARKKTYDFPETSISNIFVRLKVISEMDISEKRKPQDGRIDGHVHEGHVYDLRVSTVTTVYGEKAVMRISDKSGRILTFEELGFSEEDAAKVRGLLGNKNGILYIAGATGSGKTTTLYSMIDELNNDTVNIYTIENPVERTVENVNQIQIDPLAGVTYPSTLRALLRQDPDVIIVGEIRDTETAELSVQSSLTGHLVLSTIHANNALESINRLLNMGVEPYLVVGSSLGFLSQRLVRKLCPICKRPHGPLTTREQAWMAHHGVELDATNLYQATGCDQCVDGYKGRVAVVETVEMSERLQELILDGAHLSQLREQALQDGFIPLAQNGAMKAAAGITTLDELIKELH